MDKYNEDNCIHISRSYFPGVVFPLVVKKMFDDERRADILTISKSVKDSFNSTIVQWEWIDEATKFEAKMKLNELDFIVGYQEELSHQQANNDEKFNHVHI